MDWQAMVLLGAYHGINPGMGWLFAVALGLQQGSARGVWRALPPIVAGHALSIGVVLVTVGVRRERNGCRHPHGGVLLRHDTCRMGCLSEAGSQPASHRVVQ